MGDMNGMDRDILAVLFHWSSPGLGQCDRGQYRSPGRVNVLPYKGHEMVRSISESGQIRSRKWARAQGLHRAEGAKR
ncbi:hypothetical protein PoB_005707200 [Plakobranchus ocellatus]|uniref:Uncharacterized protein n=1 Tax=Plakobranchus ocellatus TaxID=259542 RepID=A0AAV4CG42_9GAST|nr:hypothetical protein PoB_005707200 [Plakobranchus ocellatus]